MNRFRHKFARKPIKNTSIRIEAFPSMNESERRTIDDWQRFTEEFVEELDQVTSTPDGRHRSLVPTNIGNSQYFAALHHDSKSGIPHLHLVVNRIDRNGSINDCHFIGERAVAAAQAINLRHGWRDPMEIQEEHLQRIADDCMAVLRMLPSFSWNGYMVGLQRCGHRVKLQRDREGTIRGNSVRMNSSVYKFLGTRNRQEADTVEDRKHMAESASCPETCGWARHSNYGQHRYTCNQTENYNCTSITNPTSSTGLQNRPPYQSAVSMTPIKARLDDASFRLLDRLHARWLEQEKQVLGDQFKQQETLWQNQGIRLVTIIRDNEGV